MPIPPKEVFKTRLEEFLTLHGLIFAGATQLVAPAPTMPNIFNRAHR